MGDGILLSFDEAIALVGRRGATARLIAIDGLPLSGKSTLAERMATAHGLAILPFDDFVLPRHMRPKGIAPGYPFPYFRTDAFRRAVRDLLAHGACTYLPFNWKTGRLQGEQTTLRADGPVIVEGCSTLDPELATHYDLRLFLESDRPSLLAARAIRDGHSDTRNWHDLYVPSADLYLATTPQSRADHLVAGRGVWESSRLSLGLPPPSLPRKGGGAYRG